MLIAMRTTKVVNITVCDLCGREQNWPDRKCSSCGREICERCQYSLRVTVEGSMPYPTGGFSTEDQPDGLGHTSVLHRNLEMDAIYCANCGGSIFAKLLEAGLKEREHSRNAVAMDAVLNLT